MSKNYMNFNAEGELITRDQAITDAIAEEAVLAVTSTVGLGDLVRVATEMTRVADGNAYAAGDVVSNNVVTTTLITLANVARANDVGGRIVGVRLATDKKSITPRFRVHFWRATGGTISGDNVAQVAVYADEAKKIGYIDLPALTTPAGTAGSNMSFIQDFTVRLPFLPVAGGRDIYAHLETRDVFTPASAEKFTLTVWCDQN